MIPYMVDKHAPKSSHLTRGLVKYVSGRSYFCTVPSQNGDKMITSPPPPIVERVAREMYSAGGGRLGTATNGLERQKGTSLLTVVALTTYSSTLWNLSPR